MNRTAITFGALFTALGGAFLLDDLGVLTVRLATLLPVLLVVAGLALVAGALADVRR